MNSLNSGLGIESRQRSGRCRPQDARLLVVSRASFRVFGGIGSAAFPGVSPAKGSTIEGAVDCDPIGSISQGCVMPLIGRFCSKEQA
ncbi:hypothetical protein [Thermosporothrix hazakensis]|uniref:hypothetical protein n=1 Tax=Thermosporothrix hazakensis TaxID=644383 RepID=UPI0010F6B6F6|nr:hypothetical protein [Thermosporothrix hazakensis]